MIANHPLLQRDNLFLSGRYGASFYKAKSLLTNQWEQGFSKAGFRPNSSAYTFGTHFKNGSTGSNQVSANNNAGAATNAPNAANATNATQASGNQAKQPNVAANNPTPGSAVKSPSTPSGVAGSPAGTPPASSSSVQGSQSVTQPSGTSNASGSSSGILGFLGNIFGSPIVKQILPYMILGGLFGGGVGGAAGGFKMNSILGGLLLGSLLGGLGGYFLKPQGQSQTNTSEAQAQVSPSASQAGTS